MISVGSGKEELCVGGGAAITSRDSFTTATFQNDSLSLFKAVLRCVSA